jgi:hypothetical protein
VDDSARRLWKDSLIAYLHTVIPDDAARRHLPSITDRWTGFGDADVAIDSTVGRDDLSEATADEIRRWAQFDMGMDQRARFTAFIDRLERSGPGDTPDFSYFHAAVPHAPWQYLPSGQRYHDTATPGLDWGTDTWEHDRALIDAARQRYLLQLGFVDRMIGQLLDRLDNLDLTEQVMLIVTADHGINFDAGEPRRNVEAGDVEAIMTIPMFVKLPGQRVGTVDTRPAQLTDVFATVVDHMGVELPDRAAPRHGVSLLGPAVARAERAIWSGNELDVIPEVLDVSERVAADWATFGLGAGPAGAYRAGPGGAVVGRSVAEVGSGVTSAEFILTGGEKWDDVDAEASTVPSIAVGTVEGVAPGTPVAVALNGTFAGSGWVVEQGAAPTIRVPLDPAFLVDGANEIAVYIIG